MVNRFTLSFLRTHPRTNLLDAWRLVSSYPLASTHTAGFSAHASISAEAASFKSIPPTAQSLVRLLYSLALGLRTFAFLTKTKHMTIGMTHVHLTNIPRLVRWLAKLLQFLAPISAGKQTHRRPAVHPTPSPFSIPAFRTMQSSPQCWKNLVLGLSEGPASAYFTKLQILEIHAFGW